MPVAAQSQNPILARLRQALGLPPIQSPGEAARYLPVPSTLSLQPTALEFVPGPSVRPLVPTVAEPAAAAGRGIGGTLARALGIGGAGALGIAGLSLLSRDGGEGEATFDPEARARLLAMIDELSATRPETAPQPAQERGGAASGTSTTTSAGGDTAALMDAVLARALAETPEPRPMTRGVLGPSLPPDTQAETPPTQASSGGVGLGTLLPILGVAGLAALVAGAAADRRKTRRVGSTVYKGRNVPADILSVLGLAGQTVGGIAAQKEAKAQKKTAETEESRREGLKWLLQYGGLRPEEFAASYFGGVSPAALTYAPRQDPGALGKLVGSATFRESFGPELQSQLLTGLLGTEVTPGELAKTRDPLMSGVARTVLGSTKAPEKAKQAVADWVAGTIDDATLAAQLAAVPPVARAGAGSPPMSESQARMWVISGANPDLVQKVRSGTATQSEYLSALRQIADKQGTKDAYSSAATQAQLAFNLGVMGGMDNPVVKQLTDQAFTSVSGATKRATPDQQKTRVREIEGNASYYRSKFSADQLKESLRLEGYDLTDPELESTIRALYED